MTNGRRTDPDEKPKGCGIRKTIRLITWNVGGIPFLRTPPALRNEKKREIQAEIQRLTETCRPDFVLFQEVVRYNRAGTRSGAEELIVPPPGYHYRSYIAINTRRQNHPAKWNPIRSEHAGDWPDEAYLGQGNGIMWRRDIPHCSIWDYQRKNASVGPVPEVETIRIDTGLFTGNRDTEPRLAVVTHFVHGPTDRDIFIVNLHMTTLRGEREGFPEKDSRGSEIRLNQVAIVLNGIVSRYNEWREQQGKTRSDERAVWILGGDFNATPDSDEIGKIRQMNFMDLCEDARGTGSKRSKYGHRASITVDYIFAGPQYFAFDPHQVRRKLRQFRESDPQPCYGPIYADNIESISDHYPVLACFPLA
ncbi:hypothetical protein DENIS_4820 [Desulfonema ishimotonii]|uniref:Endonuclease/exonuclease/phosphatase domain-containing protein n=1 Tax=Desulfonema ishimotonii TaxID=45657 RepID=A0A401G3K2_9BACT|nr:endonuclease/exonuclease/phosphatase family protein [Desulfonema ishimotonii]GBC63822.1 hypothetical protein DENIS_4820 [Desulfonema ishimotonii]